MTIDDDMQLQLLELRYHQALEVAWQAEDALYKAIKDKQIARLHLANVLAINTPIHN